MVKKKEISKKNAKGKMKLKDEDDPITISDNGEDEYPLPEIGEILRHIPFPRLPFVVRSKGNLRDMWSQGDEGYPMRTYFYTKPTNVVRKMADEVGKYVLLDEDDIDYIISPREIKEKNTKGTPKEKTVVLSEDEGKDLDDLPEVYHSDKEIDTEEIDDFEIETPVNIVADSESEYNDINEEQEGWVRYAQVGIDWLRAEDGYYNTHSSDDEDNVPTVKDLERGNEFESADVELDDIYSKEEDEKFKTPLTVGFKKLEVGMQWATVYVARELMRRFGILNTFTYTCIKNDNTRLRLKCSQEKSWVAREVELLVKDVRAMTPNAIKARIKTKYGVEISYWTAWNARQICMESKVGSYAQGYHDLPSLYAEILKSNPGSIARTWRHDDTLQ
ncbi:hypothetical protein GIB67_005705 [Kingdonia uniflora]|uniref:Uncharacterized protein n=1 Tax=Kingdonia uniflora TaxID=39325 RepID=A0A7J7NHW8_9MAGN|nr:hypothetical protein GIB67_005705 [Kingdonia uniflora]